MASNMSHLQPKIKKEKEKEKEKKKLITTLYKYIC